MSFLSGLLGGGTGDSGIQPARQTPSDTIDKLCDRLVHSTLLEDRRASVLALKGLSRDYQLEVGTKAMPILLAYFKNTRSRSAHEHSDAADDDGAGMEDPEMTKAILDTLIHLCDSHADTKKDNLGLQFSEIFIKDPSNTSHLLQDTLAHTHDFHVTYAALELIKILTRNHRKMMQDTILTACPRGVSFLVDLLDDAREVLRNEALLLLIDMTYQNTDLQKMIAFESVFERVLGVIQMQGGCAEGDVVVQDCFQLITNLLMDNHSNQNYFRESGLIARLKPFLELPMNQMNKMDSGTLLYTIPPNDRVPPIVWTDQQRINVGMVFNVLHILLGSNPTSLNAAQSKKVASSGANPSVKANKDAFFNSGMLEHFIGLALSHQAPLSIQAKSLKTIALLLRDHTNAKVSFSKSSVRADASHPPEPLFMKVLMRCLNVQAVGVNDNPNRAAEGDDMAVRFGAFEVIKSYLASNADLKKVLLKMMGLPDPSLSPQQRAESLLNGHQRDNTPAALLLSSILDMDYMRRKDPYRAWFAACILTLVIAEVDVAKTKDKVACLDITIPDTDDASPTSPHVGNIQNHQQDFSGEGLLQKLVACAMTCSRESLNSPDAPWGLSPEGRVLVAYLSVLAMWMAGAPEVVHTFLADGINFSFLIERVLASGSSSTPLIQGLAAFVLGLCFEFNEDGVKGLTRGEVQSIVINRIGSDLFLQRLAALRDHLTSAASVGGAGSASGKTNEYPLFDDGFITMAIGRGILDLVLRNVVNPDALHQKRQEKEEKDQKEVVLEQYKKLIAEQDGVISGLRKEVDQLKKSASASATSPTQPQQQQSLPKDKETISQLERQVQEWKQKYETTQKEMEDLLVCLAEQDMEVNKLKDRLRTLGEEVSDDDVDPEDGVVDGEELV